MNRRQCARGILEAYMGARRVGEHVLRPLVTCALQGLGSRARALVLSSQILDKGGRHIGCLMDLALANLWVDTAKWLLDMGVQPTTMYSLRPHDEPYGANTKHWFSARCGLQWVITSPSFGRAPGSRACLELTLSCSRDIYMLEDVLGVDVLAYMQRKTPDMAWASELCLLWLTRWRRWLHRDLRALWLAAAAASHNTTNCPQAH